MFNPQAVSQRAALYRAIRNYFDSRGYLETETPILCPRPIPEASIELFCTKRLLSSGEQNTLYLLPSPEYWMKRLLSSGSPSLYQIGKCFRNGEQIDRWHRLEFTMLEWYKLQASANDNLRETETLMQTLSSLFQTDPPESLSGSFRRMSMESAFQDFAGFSLETDLKNAGFTGLAAWEPGYRDACMNAAEILSERLRERGLPIGEHSESSADDMFHRLFLTLVEDRLPRDRPLALQDWPALVPTLARSIPGTPWVERWELYIRGIEVANCYSEENDLKNLEAYWTSETELKAISAVPVPSDPAWPGTIARGMDDCSGVALGLDRLLALLRGDENLQGLDLFPINDMIGP